ncbi:MAG: mechanosensitive ion channel family protein [Candidatus Nanopelagicales bacterium]
MASVSPSPTPTPAEPPTVTDAVSWWGEWLFSGAPFRIVGIFVLAAVVNWVLARLIKRVVARTAAETNRERRAEDPEKAGLLKERRQQRAHAIGQLVRSVVAVAIWGSALLMALPLLGIDIAPLLASAGVIGVALGFGAQTLVKDYLSGIFLILEDQFGVGDFVDLGEAIGTVEEVTLRVTRLRDTSGVVWYVRNGEILRVANRSQGWTVAIIDIPVSYAEDLHRVQEIVDRAADEMVADPDCIVTEFSRPAYAGVESVSGEAVTVRVTAKSDPDSQVALTREIRERLKRAFDAAGIVVPVVYRVPGATGQGAGAQR